MKQAVEIIMDKMNTMSNQDKAAQEFYEAFISNHRTLQANAIRMLQTFLQKYSTAPHDPRNEAAVEWANNVSKDTTHIPFI